MFLNWFEFFFVQVANRIKKVYLDMEEANRLIDEKNYVESTKKLKMVKEIISNEEIIGQDEDEDQIKAFEVRHAKWITVKFRF